MQVRLTSLVVGLAVAAGSVGVAAAAAPSGPSAPAAEYAPGRVLVHYASGVDVAAQQALEHASGASRLSRIDDLGVTVLSVPAGAEQHVVDALEHSGKVSYAERDAVTHSASTPDDPQYGSTSGQSGQWGIPLTNTDSAWDITTGAKSTVIAVIDSGVAAHPDLISNLLTGWNVLTQTSDSTDTNGHGTASAGVAAAATNNGLGTAGYCWTCGILPVKVETGTTANQSDVASGITWAADHGAKVISLSLGGSSSTTAMQDAVLYAQQKGALVVAAAMNNGCDCPQYPAAYPGVVAVAAASQVKALTSYSDFGSWVDLAGPSQDVTEMLQDSSGAWGYGTIGGTSIATPAVAGIAALLLTTAPNATAADVASALVRTTQPLSGSNLPANGLVDARAAMTAIAGGQTVPSSPTPAPSASPSASPTSSPSATPTSSPAASPSSSPTATASPSPAATQATSPATNTYSGSLSSKTSSRAFSTSVGSGTMTDTLTFSKCSALTITVSAADGTQVGTVSGPSPLTLSTNVTAGAYVSSVAGSCRTSFTLTVTAPQP
jgi:subtilisin family serine protease